MNSLILVALVVLVLVVIARVRAYMHLTVSSTGCIHGLRTTLRYVLVVPLSSFS